MMREYCSAEQAAKDADWLQLPIFSDDLPALLLSAVYDLVADPRSSSDALLITADALRSTARNLLTPVKQCQQLQRIANRIVILAPTRANPIA